MGSRYGRVRATAGVGGHTVRHLAQDVDVRHEGPGLSGDGRLGRSPPFPVRLPPVEVRPGRLLWPAVRRRDPLCLAGRHDHLRAARRRSDRPPLLCYFAVLRSAGYLVGRRLHRSCSRTAALALAAASNDVEFVIAVAIGVLGVTSGQALSRVGGSPIEASVLGGLVYVALWARRPLDPRKSAPVSKREQLHARLPAHRFDDQQRTPWAR